MFTTGSGSVKSFYAFFPCFRSPFLLLFLDQFRGEMSELDDAGTYFDMKPRKVTDLGTYHYMCTRNNNFSNRSQKGKITVGLAALAYKMIGWNGGAIELTGG